MSARLGMLTSSAPSYILDLAGRGGAPGRAAPPPTESGGRMDFPFPRVPRPAPLGRRPRGHPPSVPARLWTARRRPPVDRARPPPPAPCRARPPAGPPTRPPLQRARGSTPPPPRERPATVAVSGARPRAPRLPPGPSPPAAAGLRPPRGERTSRSRPPRRPAVGPLVPEQDSACRAQSAPGPHRTH